MPVACIVPGGFDFISDFYVRFWRFVDVRSLVLACSYERFCLSRLPQVIVFTPIITAAVIAIVGAARVARAPEKRSEIAYVHGSLLLLLSFLVLPATSMKIFRVLTPCFELKTNGVHLHYVSAIDRDSETPNRVGASSAAQTSTRWLSDRATAFYSHITLFGFAFFSGGSLNRLRFGAVSQRQDYSVPHDCRLSGRHPFALCVSAFLLPATDQPFRL